MERSTCAWLAGVTTDFSTSQTDANNHTTTELVNDRNQVYEVQGPIPGDITRMEHDLDDRIVSIDERHLRDGIPQPNEWLTTTYTHNTFGRVLTEVREISSTTSAIITRTYTPRMHRARSRRDRDAI